MSAPPPENICTGKFFYRDFCGSAWQVGWPGMGPPSSGHGLIDGQGCGNHARMYRDSLGRTLYIVGQGPGDNRWPYPDPNVDPEAFDFFRALYQPATPEEQATQDAWVRQQYTSLLLGRMAGVQNPLMHPLAEVTDQAKKTSWEAQFHCNVQPLPTYCPNDFLTRGQVAALIVKTVAWIADHPGQKLPTTAVQQFSDVPPSNQFFAAVNAIYLAGITAGKSPCAT